MSPSRLVCWNQCATASSASCHCPVSRPPGTARVRTGPRVPGLPLEVPEPGMHRRPDHVIDLADQPGPVRRAIPVPGQPCQPARSPPARRGRSISTSTTRSSGRNTTDCAAPAPPPRPEAPGAAQPSHAAPPPADGETNPPQACAPRGAPAELGAIGGLALAE